MGTVGRQQAHYMTKLYNWLMHDIVIIIIIIILILIIINNNNNNINIKMARRSAGTLSLP